MCSEQILHHITGQLATRFDGVPDSTLRSIVRETLIARETVRFDGADEIGEAQSEGANPQQKLIDQAKGTTDGKRDAATKTLRDMWKKEKGQ